MAKLTKQEVLLALRTVDQLPAFARGRRTIYETQHGDFAIDFAAFKGGVSGDVPRSVIDELVGEGKLKHAYPDALHIKVWVLAEGV